MNDVYKKLLIHDTGIIHFNEPLSQHCTWEIGGNADVMVEPSNLKQLGNILTFSIEHSIPYIVIGRGANILFSDDGYSGIVIKIGNAFSKCVIDKEIVRCESGVWVSGLARRTANLSLSGLEHTIGIPSTIGGLVYMNGGSMRQCIANNIVSVKTLSQKAQIKTYSADECCFDYRGSRFQTHSEEIIIEVTLKLKHGNKHEIRREMLSILRQRRTAFPLKQPSCGSVFKINNKIYNEFGPPGKIIENLGLKGYRVGNVMVSPKHANFFVNLGGAKASDVLELVKYVNQKIAQKTGNELVCEVRYIESPNL